MSDERDELAKVIANNSTVIHDSHYGDVTASTLTPDEMAEAILAAGYRKPQQVTTIEELDAAVLAAFEEGQHLVLSDCHARPWIIWSDEDGDEQVNSWPQEEDHDRLALGDITLPATVLHVGGAE